MSEGLKRSRSPLTGRFQKGHSGNPKGRPRKKQPGLPEATHSAFDIVMAKRVTVTQGGVDQELSVDEALQLRTYQDALAGNRSAQREILKMIAKREKAIAKRGRRTNVRATLKIEPMELRDIDDAMCLLGIAGPDKKREVHNPGALLLEPWAVQAALSRRRGGKALTPEDVAEIKRCARDPETLRWPRGVIS
jgi:hypothetical protein